jgi:uncharacterized membrane protein YcaP (DUF421 family)
MINGITIIIRAAIMFFLTLFLVRILGKGNPLKATAFKFVTYIVIAIIAALLSAGIITNLVFGAIALGVWTLFTIAIDYLAIKSKKFHDLINGKETILIKDGKVMEENLLKERLTGEELLRELRFKSVFNLADVEFAVMESTGDINVLLRAEKKPVTAHDLQKKVNPSSEPQIVILDGNIMDEGLTSRGLNRQWLNTELEKLEVILENVFIGQVDSSGDLYVDLFDDTVQVQVPKVKELLYANLQKCQADLVSFSLETENKRAKAMFEKDADKLKEIMDKLEPYLLR